MTSGGSRLEGEGTVRDYLREYGTRTSAPRNGPACLDFRQPDSPLVTKS